jgi:hypothetical protein
MAQQPTQGQQGAPGTQTTRGRRPFTPEVVGKLAAAAALVVFVGEVVLNVVIDALRENVSADLGSVLESQLTGLPYDGFLFAAVLWIALAQGDKDSLVKGSALAYAGSLASDILGIIIYDFEADLVTFVSPLYASFTVLGIGMVIRLYHGKTLLPWVDVRI